MNESIRTDLRDFFNILEKEHPGIKHNAYGSMTKISKILRSIPSDQGKKCSKCGKGCTGDVCSVCRTLNVLTSNKQI